MPNSEISSVSISHVNYDGEETRTEGDEYAEITNNGDAPADISGWQLSAGDRGQDFTFPEGTVLEPGASCRVYTNREDSETGGFSFDSGRAIWNNKGDIGVLYDAQGEEISRYAYGSEAPAATEEAPDATEQSGSDVASSPTTILWATMGASLLEISSDGTDPREVVPDAGASSVAIDLGTNSLFYDDGSTRDLIRADLDGANPTTIATKTNTFAGLAVDSVNGKLYWTEFGYNRIRRANLDGSNVELVCAASGNPSAIALDIPNGRLYFITYNSTTLYSVNIDGTDLTTLCKPGGQGAAVAFDASTQKVYFAVRGPDLFTINPDGSNQTALVTGQGAVQGLAIDTANRKLYWFTAKPGKIRRADLADGGNIEDVSNASGSVWQLAIKPAQ